MPHQNWVFFSFCLPDKTASSRLMISLKQDDVGLSEQKQELLKAYLTKGVHFILQTLSRYEISDIQEAICRFCLCLPEEIFKAKIFSKIFLFELKPLSKARRCLSLDLRQVQLLDDPSCTFGRVTILFETDDFGIYFLKIRPNGSIPKHFHEKLTEHEMVFSDHILAKGEWASFGKTFAWNKNEVHSYDNPFLEEKIILCIDEPKFNHLDEIAV